MGFCARARIGVRATRRPCDQAAALRPPATASCHPSPALACPCQNTLRQSVNAMPRWSCVHTVPTWVPTATPITMPLPCVPCALSLLEPEDVPAAGIVGGPAYHCGLAPVSISSRHLLYNDLLLRLPEPVSDSPGDRVHRNPLRPCPVCPSAVCTVLCEIEASWSSPVHRNHHPPHLISPALHRQSSRPSTRS
jgi:hypothetical protein